MAPVILHRPRLHAQQSNSLWSWQYPIHRASKHFILRYGSINISRVAFQLHDKG